MKATGSATDSQPDVNALTCCTSKPRAKTSVAINTFVAPVLNSLMTLSRLACSSSPDILVQGKPSLSSCMQQQTVRPSKGQASRELWSDPRSLLQSTRNLVLLLQIAAILASQVLSCCLQLVKAGVTVASSDWCLEPYHVMQRTGSVPSPHKDDSLPQFLAVWKYHFLQHFLLVWYSGTLDTALLDHVQTELLPLEKHLWTQNKL